MSKSLPLQSDATLAGLSEDALIEYFAAVGRVVKTRCLNRKPILSSWQTVLDYLRSAMAFEPREQFRVLFLNKRNRLIADEVMQHGTVDHVPVYPREIMRRAIELGATALILAHNHPTGDSTPSHADIEMTKLVIESCKVIGIAVHDHVIIGRDNHVSFRAAGLM
jgi:DNA repair protein RadC